MCTGLRSGHAPPLGELGVTVSEIFSQELYCRATWISLPKKTTRERHDESGGSSARSRRFQPLEAAAIRILSRSEGAAQGKQSSS
jgi:hypothetical protein